MAKSGKVGARADLQLWFPYILISLLPIIVFVSLELLVGTFIQTPSYTALEPLGGNYRQWTEEAARLQFFALFSLFFLFSCAVFIKFVCDLFLFDSAGKFRLALAFALCAITGLAVIVSGLNEHMPRTYDYFGRTFFAKALECADPKTCKWNWGTFQTVIKWWVNIPAVFAVSAFIAGGISCLGTRTRGKSDKHDKDSNNQKQYWIMQRECWIMQQERLQTYIYLSAALLVISVVFLKAWTQYPTFILKVDEIVAYKAVVNSFSIFTGIEYTLLLAAYALPISLCLSRDADRIAEGILAAKKQQSTLAEKRKQSALEEKTEQPALTMREIRRRERLVISSRDILKTIIALLSPLITGSIETLISVVK